MYFTAFADRPHDLFAGMKVFDGAPGPFYFGSVSRRVLCQRPSDGPDPWRLEALWGPEPRRGRERSAPKRQRSN
jgi:hypothetical protein